MKLIIKAIAFGLVASTFLNAGGNTDKVKDVSNLKVVQKTNIIYDDNLSIGDLNNTQGDVFYSEAIDIRGFKFNNSNKCQSIVTSGIFEIKNKNMDFDKNKVYFRHQRITYVLGDNLAALNKDCFMNKTEELDIPNLHSLLKFLGN